MTIEIPDLELKLSNDLSVERTMRSPYRDTLYFRPSPEWVSKFGDWLESAPRGSYTTESWDCDDFAMWASTQASIANSQAGRTCGHTVFIAYILAKKNFCGLVFPSLTDHATLLILDSTNEWTFLEPQTGYSMPAKRALESGIVESIYYVIV